MIKSVYFLDDEEEICLLYQEVFSVEKCKIKTFTKYRQLIEACETEKPDVIFLDYRMPEMKGDEVAKKLPVEIPKYLLTGELSIKTDYPFKKIFTKPVNIDEIKQIIDEVVLFK